MIIREAVILNKSAEKVISDLFNDLNFNNINEVRSAVKSVSDLNLDDFTQIKAVAAARAIDAQIKSLGSDLLDKVGFKMMNIFVDNLKWPNIDKNNEILLYLKDNISSISSINSAQSFMKVYNKALESTSKGYKSASSTVSEWSEKHNIDLDKDNITLSKSALSDLVKALSDEDLD